MLRLVGVLLMILAFVIGMAPLGLDDSSTLNHTFAGVFCAQGETLHKVTTGNGEDSNTAIYCQAPNGTTHSVAAAVAITTFASCSVLLVIGIVMFIGSTLARRKRSMLAYQMAYSQGMPANMQNWSQFNGMQPQQPMQNWSQFNGMPQQQPPVQNWSNVQPNGVSMSPSRIESALWQQVERAYQAGMLSKDNVASVLQQYEQAYQAGMISSDEIERIRVTLQQFQQQ